MKSSTIPAKKCQSHVLPICRSYFCTENHSGQVFFSTLFIVYSILFEKAKYPTSCLDVSNFGLTEFHFARVNVTLPCLTLELILLLLS